jgi:hypothetical protein
MADTSDDDLLKLLIQGGLIGGSLVALLSNKENAEENISIGALVGAAILASYKANLNAKKTNLPVYEKQGDSIFAIYPDGTKKFIKKIEPINIIVPNRFKLSTPK